MSSWISDSVDLLAAVAALLTSPGFFALVGCILLLPAVKLFKSLVGG